jgi:hypothetical protein
MKLNVQEGINAEKQQVIAIVYSGRFVICSDTIFDEVDLRKYSSLSKFYFLMNFLSLFSFI